MRGDTRCVEGRLMRHDPQDDDPYLETDRGVCPECNGAGCDIDAATGTADDQSPVSAAVGLLLDKHDGIHGTNGYRGPTEAEQRAFAAVQVEIVRQQNNKVIDPEKAPIDMMGIIRVVIRSLIEPTDAMIDAMYASGTYPDVPEKPESIHKRAIEAASPEIKT